MMVKFLGYKYYHQYKHKNVIWFHLHQKKTIIEGSGLSYGIVHLANLSLKYESVNLY